MESRVRTLERASVPAEQVEFPGCVEADVMDRLGGVHAGNRSDRQRTVRALPAPVDAGARLDDGRPATGNPVTPGPRFIDARHRLVEVRSEEHTSELQSLMRISYAVFCLNKKTNSLQY